MGGLKPLECQDAIASGIARRTLNHTELQYALNPTRRQLAEQPLQPNCASKAGLTDDVKRELRQLAETPDPKPPAANPRHKPSR